MSPRAELFEEIMHLVIEVYGFRVSVETEELLERFVEELE